ncbi:MAG: hypothetical protein AB1695_04820 [Stygiobacter sp.]|jgi:C4-type Zn-finger protein|uniref:Uncharacterized protein n=1 Tax=Stygiobacter electus TaxID=3032292 RepID=A0AAE3P045_9BACT|nr:hypothetical protein [Stygiobacter electus]MDF1611854.1 hypothetical protein [Stygiobacter electus]
MAKDKILFYRNPQFSRCPSCKSIGTLHRSRSRNMFEQIVRKTSFIKVYRCKECGWRGFRSTLIFTKKSIRTLLIYILLMGITAYLAQYVILHYVMK